MAKGFGAGYAVTEMVSVEGVARNLRKTLSYAVLDDEWTGVQLFGGPNPERFYDAALVVKERYNAKIVDINFGWPVRKVIRAGAGSALLNDPAAMAEIGAAVKRAGLIVTAKIRSGFDGVNIDETIPALDKAGADAIIYHARTAKQMYAGKADWSLIRKARDLTDKPLIANGDVVTPEDAERCSRRLSRTGS
jgi:tRNA-dihydrouridine synthase B